MEHKFTIEYDMHQGLFRRDDGRDKCLGIYDSLDDAESEFYRKVEQIHGYFMDLPYETRKRTSYLVACYCWEVDEDGELTCEEAWNDLSEEEKKRLNALNVSYGV